MKSLGAKVRNPIDVQKQCHLTPWNGVNRKKYRCRAFAEKIGGSYRIDFSRIRNGVRKSNVDEPLCVHNLLGSWSLAYSRQQVRTKSLARPCAHVSYPRCRRCGSRKTVVALVSPFASRVRCWKRACCCWPCHRQVAPQKQLRHDLVQIRAILDER